MPAHRLVLFAALAAACSNPALQQSHSKISADPQAIDFGAQTAGAKSTQTLNIHNTGQASLTIASVGISGDTRGAFSLGPLPTSLGAGDSAQVNVTYTAPGQEGADGATLTVFSDADNAPELAISLSGHSVKPTVTHTLTVVLAGNGSGSVSGNGISCSPTCSVSLADGTAVSLAATPSGASRFAGFSGACTGSTCALTLTADATVTATFVATFDVSVTFAGTGSGTVDFGGAATACTATCTRTFDGGTSVSINGTHGTNSVFAGFSGDCTGAGTCTATAAKSITATFTATHTLTVAFGGSGTGTATGTGGISCPGTCAVTLAEGASVSLDATANSGSRFDAWSGPCSGATCSFTMGTSDTTATATFVQQYALTVTFAGDGAGTVDFGGAATPCTASCAPKFDVGTALTVTGTPTGSDVFKGFSGDYSGNPSFSIASLGAAAGVTATFQQTHGITVTVVGSGSVSSSPAGINSCTASGGTCTATFADNALVTLTATASGSTFSGWTGGGCGGTGTCGITLTGANASTTATFTTAATPGVFGGAGDQFATGITYADGKLWVSGNEGGGAGGIVARLSLPIDQPDFVNVWPASGASQDYFNGIAAGPSAVYAVGASLSMTTDTVGGPETKMAIVKYPFTTSGAPSAYEWFQNIGGGTAIEYFAGGAVLNESGTTYVYGVGMAQYPNLDWVVKANDPSGSPTTEPAASSPVWSHNFTSVNNAGGNGAAAWANGGGVYAIGSDNDTSPTHPILAAYDTSGTQSWVVRAPAMNFGYSGFFNGVTAAGSAIYVVGQTSDNARWIAEKYDTSGNRQWSQGYQTSGDNALRAVVSLGTHVYAVGFTAASGSGCSQSTPCKAVLADIDATDGTLHSTTVLAGDASHDAVANGITTDGTDLYVAGHQYIDATNGYDIFVKKVAGPPASPIWTLVSTTGGPPAPRAYGATLADAASPILFAGNYNQGGNFLPSNDTWVLTGSAWGQLTTTGGPPGARANHGAVYDATNNRMMIFGGCTGTCSPVASDYWVLTNADGTSGTPTWSSLSPSGSVSGRQSFAMAYDATANRTIVFGGQNGGGDPGATLSDVSVLTNANGLGGTPAWSQLTQSGAEAPGQYSPSWGYDEANARLIVVGGSAAGTGAPTNAAYVLSNANGVAGTTATWTNLVAEGATGSPPVGGGRPAAYDPATNRLVMIGGANLNDIWVLSNANGLGGTPTWSLVPASGGPSGSGGFVGRVYDPATKTLTLLFSVTPVGGSLINEVWKLSNAVGP